MIVEYALTWWVLLIALGLLAILIYLNYRSRRSRWQMMRWIANVLIVVCLLGLYSKPYYEVAAEQIKVALLTESQTEVETDSLRSLGYRIITTFDDYLNLKSEQEIEELIILGDGLESWELDQLSHAFNYLRPDQLPEGPVAVSSNDAVMNAQSTITFKIATTDSLDVHLVGTGIENAIVPLDIQSGVASFDIRPKVAGNLTYELFGVRGIDTLFAEVVPMKVRDRVRFNTLILTSTPSFEVRFLKNLLKDEGYRVAERLQVSKDTYRESFSNLNRRSLKRLSKTLLQDFKVLVLDKDSYDALSYTERQNVNVALRKGDIGIIWMDNASNTWLRTRRIEEQSVSFKANQQTVELERAVSSTGYSLAIAHQNNVIGHVHTVGLGKVMIPLLSATYQLKLKGYDELHSELWNAILQPVVGFDKANASIGISDFPRIGEPTTFSFRGDDETVVYLDAARLATKEKWHQPGVFTTKSWPTRKGWNELEIGEERYSFFTYGSNDWRAQKAQQKQDQTAAFKVEANRSGIQVIQIKRPLSPWLFFSILVLAFGFLWLEGRLS